LFIYGAKREVEVQSFQEKIELSYNEFLKERKWLSRDNNITKSSVQIIRKDSALIKNNLFQTLSFIKSRIKGVFEDTKNAESEAPEYELEYDSNNSNLLKRKRGKSDKNMDNEDKDSNLKLPYGCVREGTTIDLMLTLGNLTKHKGVKDLLKNSNVKNIENYNLSSKSNFIDLGSGFGLPCFTAFLLYNCNCFGLELSNERIKHSIVSKYSLIPNCLLEIKENNRMRNIRKIKKKDEFNYDFNEIMETVIFKEFTKSIKKVEYYPPLDYHLNRLQFSKQDLINDKHSFEFKNNCPSHIYCYSKCFENKDDDYFFMRKLINKLNNTIFKVLIWTFNEERCIKYGLNGCKLIYSYIGVGKCGKQSFTFYVYIKTKYSCNEEDEEV